MGTLCQACLLPLVSMATHHHCTCWAYHCSQCPRSYVPDSLYMHPPGVCVCVCVCGGGWYGWSVGMVWGMVWVEWGWCGWSGGGVASYPGLRGEGKRRPGAHCLRMRVIFTRILVKSDILVIFRVIVTCRSLKFFQPQVNIHERVGV